MGNLYDDLAQTLSIPLGQITPNLETNFDLSAVAPYTATTGDVLWVTTANTNDTVKMPATPAAGDWVIVVNNQANLIRVDGNGNPMVQQGMALNDAVVSKANLGVGYCGMLGNTGDVTSFQKVTRFLWDGAAWVQFNMPFA